MNPLHLWKVTFQVRHGVGAMTRNEYASLAANDFVTAAAHANALLEQLFSLDQFKRVTEITSAGRVYVP